MTTIVVNSKCIAADRQLLIKGDDGGTHFTDGPKIKLSPCGTFAYGSTGIDLSKNHTEDLEKLFRAVAHHFSGGGQLTDEGFTEMALAVNKRVKKPTLILTRKVFISIIEGLIAVSDEYIDYYAVGTGATFASSAMLSGKTPKQAIEFANRYDALSGFGVDVINANKLKAIKAG